MRKAMVTGALIAAFALGVVGTAFGGLDFGLDEQNLLGAKSQALFGVAKPLPASSQRDLNAPIADPLSLVKLANGLSASVVSTPANATNADMIALWPNDTNPTHLIECNEQGPAQVGLIRIALTGASPGGSQTIVNSGLTSCDPVQRTPWGTIVFGEENGTKGRVWELIDPLNTTGVAITPADSTTGAPTCASPPADAGCVGAANIIQRTALGNLSFEGIGILPSGVVYYGDENRPNNGTPGGPYFKFIPGTLRTGNAPITDLTESPLVAGLVYGMRLGKRAGNTDYGQGTQTGLGTWIPANAGSFPDLRAQAAALKLTGYYRPEDLSLDPAALADGNVRLCANNTGNEEADRDYGETICITDGTLSEAASVPLSTPQVQLFVVGNPQFAMMDNIAYQPGRGNWLIHEDGDQLRGNNDLWDCLPDGADDNLLSDGCIRVGTLNDLAAEWTGGVFDASGQHFFVSVQHSDANTGVVLDITGWK